MMISGDKKTAPKGAVFTFPFTFTFTGFADDGLELQSPIHDRKF